MPTTPATETLELARFRTVSGPEPQRIEAEVHFNPDSLQYTVQNTIKEEGKGSKKKQHVSQTTAKLTMQLVFDTTDTGEDVRVYTDDMAKLLQPYKDGKNKSPPLVEFAWGVYRFTGLAEQYKENIDFFAAGGVPLRSTVDITLVSQDVVFDSSHNPTASVDGNLSAATVHPQSDQRGQTSGPAGAAGLANALGDPRAARAIASLNGSDTLRFSAGGQLAVAGGVSLQSAAALSADAGSAFAGLRAIGPSSLSVPSGLALFAGTADVSTGVGAQFSVGGRAQAKRGSSLSADVGADADLKTRITFT